MVKHCSKLNILIVSIEYIESHKHNRQLNKNARDLQNDDAYEIEAII